MGVLAGPTALAHRRPLTGRLPVAHPHLPARLDGPSAPSHAPSAPFTRARRRAAAALGVAAGAGVALVAAAAGWYAYTETHAVLEPAAYAALRPGAPLTSLDLPDRQIQDPPADRAPAPPEGADCRYHRASGELFVSADHYRLCFDDEGRLVAKDVVPRAGGRPDAAHEESTRWSGSCRPTTRRRCGPGCAPSWTAAAGLRSSPRRATDVRPSN
ncbi:histidine kinase [Streptomyces cellulosae]|nr:histidine kinase [Streptomyces cellulosae]WTC56739.1 histidine kinase [Streptomyces cellulosae]